MRISGHDPLCRRDYLLALLSGGLLALSFPKASLSFLAWFAFVPLFLATGRKTPKDAMKLGFLAGMAAYGGIFYWLNIVMTVYGKLQWTVSFCLFLTLAGYLAVFEALAVYFTRRGEEKGITPLLFFPLLWVALELARSNLFTGFPWAALGYSQYRTLPLIQIADITGVYGLSFLIALANVVIYRIIRGLVKKRDGVGYPTGSACILLVLVVLTMFYGFHRLRIPERGQVLKVALAQGNIPQDVKWNPAFAERTVSVYERLSREAGVGGADLLVWPESAAPFYFETDTRYAPRIRSLASELKSAILFGSPAMEDNRGTTRYLNSAFLLAPDGRVVGRSDKTHLVPFGEYVPMARLLPFVNRLVTGIGDFSPGAAVTPLDTGKGKVGVLICFEGIFPELSRAYVRGGSRLLVNITNDAWFGRSSAPYQHLSMTVFRAVENRVPLVRAANTGISAIIDSRGHIRRMTPLFSETLLAGEVRLGVGETVYNEYGDFFAKACAGLSLMLVLLCLIKKSKHMTI